MEYNFDMEYILDGKKFDNQRDYRKALKELEDTKNILFMASGLIGLRMVR